MVYVSSEHVKSHEIAVARVEVLPVLALLDQHCNAAALPACKSCGSTSFSACQARGHCAVS